MEQDSAVLLDRFCRGDEAAADELYRRYAARLLALARTRLSGKLTRRVNAEDVLQSAYRSFFLRARRGDFAVERPGDLWGLLATITLHKVGRQTSRHLAAKRSIRREEQAGNDASTEIDHFNREPAAAEIVAAAEELEWLRRQLGPKQRRALELRLEEQSIGDIAKQMRCTERSVRRWLGDARAQLENRWQHLANAPARSESAGTGSAPIDVDSELSYHDYRLERLIAFGGMCKVYLASHQPSGRTVCVKVLRKQAAAQPGIVSRFLNERRLVQRVDHSQIVPIHGAGRLPGGGYFLAMDYIDGCDLATAGREGAISISRSVGIVRDVGMVVAHAHQNGVVHCDLKPHNVILDGGGRVFLTDFGFAHDLAAMDATHGGTAAFIAPEQVDARWGNVGPHTDVFGLGALLYSLLTGRPIHGDGSQSRLLRTAASTKRILPANRVNPTVPSGLAIVCAQALEKQPRARYASAADFVRALAPWDV